MVHQTASQSQSQSQSQFGVDLAAEQQRYYHDLLSSHTDAATPSSSQSVLASEPRALHTALVEQRAALERVIAGHSEVYVKGVEVKEALRSMLVSSVGLVGSVESVGLPGLVERTKEFKAVCEEDAGELEALRGLLRNQDGLLEVLEVEGLMDACVRAGEYDAALELRGFVEKMKVLHGGGRGGGGGGGRGRGRVNRTLEAVEEGVGRVMARMREQLFEQLEREVSLTVCLQVVGTLKRVMRKEGSAGLRKEFLARRGRWVDACLDEVGGCRRGGGSGGSSSSSASMEYIRGLTDVYRLQVSDVMMQYRAIFFAGGDGRAALPLSDPSFAWGAARMGYYMGELEAQMQYVTDGSHLGSVLEAVSYAGRGLARVGLDPRGQIVFGMVEDAVVRVFEALVSVAEETFEEMLAAHRWVAIPSAAGRAAEGASAGEAAGEAAGEVVRKESATASILPPMALVEHGPLAVYTNGMLVAFNELRHCAPVGVRGRVSERVERSLDLVERVLGEASRPKGDEEARVYDGACAMAKDLMRPFLLRCVEVDLFSIYGG